MSQSGYTPILIYGSGTASAVPLAADLTSSSAGAELALNYADGKLYFKNSSGTVTLLASSAGASGDVVGPASATDTAIALFDGTTGKLIKNSPVTIGSTGNTVISGTDNTNAMLRITQLGTGNALLVEDSTNPDSSPFVIDASGKVVIGNTTTLPSPVAYPLQVVGSGSMGMTLSRFDANVTAPIAAFVKSRNATIGTFGTIVNSGDALGDLRFYGDDGVTAIEAARISAAVDGTPGTNDMPGRLVFSTTADGASSPTEAMRINSGQLVSIGTAQNAQSKLYVTNTVTDTANAEHGIYSILTVNNASGSNVKIGNRSSIISGASFAGTNSFVAFRGDATYNLSSAYTGSLQGFRTSIGNSGAGAVSSVYGFVSTNTANTGGGSITNFYGFAQDDVTTATSAYGFLGSMASGSNKWNLYMSGTANNYMAGNLSIGTTTSTSMLQVAGSSSVSAIKTPNIAEVNTISATAATGTINYDVTTQSVLYYTTNASGNFTVNFRGSSGTTLNTVMQTGESISATFLVTNGATAYYNSAVQVDGSSVTPKWQGGTAPTSGNASSIDSYTYVIIKTGSAAFTVLASVTKFA